MDARKLIAGLAVATVGTLGLAGGALADSPTPGTAQTSVQQSSTAQTYFVIKLQTVYVS